MHYSHMTDEDAIKELKEIKDYSMDTFITWRPYANACDKGIDAIEKLNKIQQILSHSRPGTHDKDLVKIQHIIKGDAKPKHTKRINLDNMTKDEILEGFIKICETGTSHDSRIYVQEAKRKGISYSELCEYKNSIKK